MRALVGVLVAVPVIAGGALSGLWWLQTEQMEKELQHTLQAQQLLPVQLQYQSIERTGFPLQPGVRLIQPTFTFTGKQIRGTAQYSAIAFDKSLHELNYRIQLEGPQNTTLSVNDKSWTLQSTHQSPIIITAHFQGGIEDLLEQKRTPEQWLDRLQTVSVQSSAGEIKQGETVLITMGDSRVDLIRHPGGQHAIDVEAKINSNNTTFSPAYDAFAKELTQAMLGDIANHIDSGMSVYGAINSEYAVRYQGPTLKQFSMKQPFSVALKPARFTSDLLDSDSAISVSFRADEAETQMDFDVQVQHNMKPKFDQYLARTVQDALRSPDAAATLPTIAQMEPATLWQIAGTLIPRTSTLGTLTQKFQGSFTTTKEGTLNLNLTAVDLSATPYGLSGNGSANYNLNGKQNPFDFTFTCRACPSLFQDLTSYVHRVQYLAQRLVAPNAQDKKLVDFAHGEPLSPKIQAVGQMLQQLANANTQPDWVFHLQRGADQQLQVNNQPLPLIATMMVDGMAMGTLAQQQARNQPAADATMMLEAMPQE
jgi:hypothetical protein